MLKGIDILENIDYFSEKDKWDSMANKIVFTGKIDEFFDYKFGELEYRSLTFVEERLETEDYQGCSIVNYTDLETPQTRITEHKHFENLESDVTWVTDEFPVEYQPDITDPYYPVNDKTNNKLYEKYKKLSIKEKNVYFGGRLAEYKYYDMDKVILSALNFIENIK